MFNPQDDPLGLGLMQRARERRQAQLNANPAASGFMSGPLPDQNWDAWFQAIAEANPGKSVNIAGGPAPAVDPSAELGTQFAQHSKQIRGINPFDRLTEASMTRARKKSNTLSGTDY